MKYILILGVGDKIKEIINQGLEIILDTEHAITSIIIQLVATLLLFLAVRFLFWNKITAVIEEKENREKKAFEDLENAKKEAIELKKQIEIDTENAKQEGYKIIERAKQKSYAEAEEIVKKAQIDANMKLEDAKAQIEKEVASANENIKKEIIEVAYLLAEKIINKEINEEKHQELIDNFLKSANKEGK
ncbi:MAG: F0F1 ATP synthase subunit B [Bacilli bacterium]|nr:F0F1 ATP synthase subunit B [Bacilli bacterium]